MVNDEVPRSRNPTVALAGTALGERQAQALPSCFLFWFLSGFEPPSATVPRRGCALCLTRSPSHRQT